MRSEKYFEKGSGRHKVDGQKFRPQHEITPKLIFSTDFKTKIHNFGEYFGTKLFTPKNVFMKVKKE